MNKHIYCDVTTCRPVFNFMPITNQDSCPRSGTRLMLMYIDDMHTYDNMLLFTQMCDAGYRMVRDNEDYTKWNQCVYEDIDYKKYIEDNEHSIEPDVLYAQLYDWLYENYRDILYYTELSRSGKGYHIVFYFAVQRTKNNRMMCKALTTFIIRKAFHELGYGYIIDYPGVFDDCTDSFYQACFFTLNNYNINNDCTGRNSEQMITDNFYSVKSIYDKLFSKTVKHAKKVRKINKDSIVENEHEHDNEWDVEYCCDDTITYHDEYINHHERYYLFRSIVGMCGNKESIDENIDLIKEEWEHCARQLPCGNGHDTAFYVDEPYRNNWISWIRENEQYCYIDNEMMAKFGYSIKYKCLNNYGDITDKKTNKISKTRVYLP